MLNLAINDESSTLAEDSLVYSPMQDVAPSAVRIALAIDTMICTTNLVVSFFVIITSFLYCWGQSPRLINYRPRDNRPQDLMG